MDIKAPKPEDKPTLRKLAFARRNLAHEEIAEEVAQTVIADILSVAEGYQRIAAYMPIRSEVNVLPAMAALHDAGHEIGVPIIVSKGAPLAFHRWTPDTVMVDGPFGAAVPKEGIEITPDFVLGALVAFDKIGTRLGYGGGFYDRTVAKFRMEKDVPFVGVAYSAQELLKLPREATDVPLDAIITERSHREF